MEILIFTDFRDFIIFMVFFRVGVKEMDRISVSALSLMYCGLVFFLLRCLVMLISVCVYM